MAWVLLILQYDIYERNTVEYLVLNNNVGKAR